MIQESTSTGRLDTPGEAVGMGYLSLDLEISQLLHYYNPTNCKCPAWDQHCSGHAVRLPISSELLNGVYGDDFDRRNGVISIRFLLYWLLSPGCIHTILQVMALSANQLKVAILDDYHDLARSYIKDLPSNLEFDVYKDTIPQDDLSGLINRLEKYSVIVTMRERTIFGKELIQNLPNLKVLLTTGMRNRGLDLDALEAKEVVVVGIPGGDLP